MNMISYCDGQRTLLEIADMVGQPIATLVTILGPLIENGLIEVVGRRHEQ